MRLLSKRLCLSSFFTGQASTTKRAFCSATTAARLEETIILDSACDSIIDNHPVENVIRQLRASEYFRKDGLAGGENANRVAMLFANRLLERANELIPATFEFDNTSSEVDMNSNIHNQVDKILRIPDIQTENLLSLWPLDTQNSFEACCDALALTHSSLKLHFATQGTGDGTGTLNMELSDETLNTAMGRRILRKQGKLHPINRRKKSKSSSTLSRVKNSRVLRDDAKSRNSFEQISSGFIGDAAYLWGPQSHGASMCCQQLDLMLNSQEMKNSSNSSSNSSFSLNNVHHNTVVASNIKFALGIIADVSERRSLTGPVHTILYPWLCSWAQTEIPKLNNVLLVDRILNAFELVHTNMKMRSDLSNNKGDDDSTCSIDDSRVKSGVVQRANAEGLVSICKLLVEVSLALQQNDQIDMSKKLLTETSSIFDKECKSLDLINVRDWAIASLLQ